jgi:hypothetical protein
MKAICAAFLLVGCASARNAGEPSDADISMPEIVDAPADAHEMMVDAKVTPPVDAQPIDAPSITPADAATDAYVCQVMTRQLLLNPVFDLTPVGTNWVQQNIDNAYPIITGDGTLAEHSAPYKAWMGGIEAPTAGQSVTDVLYQDVVIPAGTTMLRLTGVYYVASAETGTTVYDTGQVALVQTNGTPIETAMSLNNVGETTAWTALDKTFTPNLSGQTVRLRFTTTNDDSFPTSFYFDTIALTATYCQ